MEPKIFDALIHTKAALAQVEVDIIENAPKAVTQKHFQKLERALLGLGAELGVTSGYMVNRVDFYPVRSR